MSRLSPKKLQVILSCAAEFLSKMACDDCTDDLVSNMYNKFAAYYGTRNKSKELIPKMLRNAFNRGTKTFTNKLHAEPTKCT